MESMWSQCGEFVMSSWSRCRGILDVQWRCVGGVALWRQVEVNSGPAQLCLFPFFPSLSLPSKLPSCSLPFHSLSFFLFPPCQSPTLKTLLSQFSPPNMLLVLLFCRPDSPSLPSPFYSSSLTHVPFSLPLISSTLSSSSSSYSFSLISLSLLSFTSHFSSFLCFFSYIILSIPLPYHSLFLIISPHLLHFFIPLLTLSYSPLQCPLSLPILLSPLHSFLLQVCPHSHSFSFPLAITPRFFMSLLPFLLFSPLYPLSLPSNLSPLLPVSGLAVLSCSFPPLSLSPQCLPSSYVSSYLPSSLTTPIIFLQILFFLLVLGCHVVQNAIGR